MRLSRYADVYDSAGSVLTATLDVSRDNENGDVEVAGRWRALSAELALMGAPGSVLDRAEEVLTQPTGLPGGWGRTVVVRDGGRSVDRLMPGRPAAHGAYGPLPHLMPLLEAEARSVPYVLVVTDRTGADITVAGRAGRWEESVQGSDSQITRVHAGGWSHLRYHHRVENQWEANAKEVAERLDELVRSAGVDVVAVAGDVRATQLLSDQVATSTRAILHELDAGGRAAGTDDEALDTQLASVRETHALRSAAASAEAFLEQRARQENAAAGLQATVEALRRGQVDVLLVPPGWDDHGTAWFGPDSSQLGLQADEVAALGADDPQQSTVTDVVLRAAAATDAQLVVVPAHLVDLEGEPAAVLRFSDASTVHDSQEAAGATTGS